MPPSFPVSYLQAPRGERYSVPTCHMKPGLICVALYNDDIWYRAIIVEDLGPQPKLYGMGVVRAFFIDYGNASRVFYHNIRSAGTQGWNLFLGC